MKEKFFFTIPSFTPKLAVEVTHLYFTEKQLLNPEF